jgi:hypothetical protein
VNQVIKRICFLDITTYHPQPYKHTRDNKDPLKRLVICPKSVFVTRRQSKTFHYLVEYKNRVPHKASRWFSYRPRKYRAKKNLQDTFLQFHDGTDAPKDLFPEQPITWYFKSDTETPKLIRFLNPKPVEVPDPVHPLSVNTDYPAIHSVFISNGITKIGNYTTDDKSWTKKPPFTLTAEERQDRRQWIYRELLQTWILQELI